jgi:hypothetical protein
MFDSFWYEMNPADFVFDASEKQDGSVCALAIVSNQQDFWLLGNSFLRGYYSIHDMTDGYLGMVPHSASVKDFVFKGEIPTQVMAGSTNLSVWTVVIISVIMIAVTLCVALLLHPYLVDPEGGNMSIGAAIAIESAIVIGVYLLCHFLLGPALDSAFAPAPAEEVAPEEGVSGMI